MKSITRYIILSILVIGSAYPVHGQSTICPSLDIYEIWQDPVVQDALADAWRDSDEGTPSEHEEGGWIVHVYDNGDNCNLYETQIIRWTGGSVAGISSGPRPNIPNGRVVADFHTHPGSAKGEDEFENHVPSKQDMEASDLNEIPGIIRYGIGDGSGSNFDLIYDGQGITHYPADIGDGIDTHLDGFYDSRISSPADMAAASYEAGDPEWRCEDHSDLDVGDPEVRDAYVLRGDIRPNPLQHKDEVLFFDYLLKIDVDFMGTYQFTTNAYLNSADGSFVVVEEDAERLKEIFSDRVPDADKFDMHYVVIDSDDRSQFKLGFYGEEKSGIFTDESPMIGYSYLVEKELMTECFLHNMEKTDDTMTYNGEEYPWYRLEMYWRGERGESFLAMKPTEMVSDAMYFNSFVGILKDEQTRQNFLVVEYKSFGFNIKLADIDKLDENFAADLKPYTILGEYDTYEGIVRYEEDKDVKEIILEIDKAHLLVKDCMNSLPPEKQVDRYFHDCWETYLQPLRDKYPHMVVYDNPY